MKSKLCITLFLALGVLLLVQPAAQADTANLYFTGTTWNGGQDVPYLMTVNGQSVWMNCDDHYDYIQGGESWTATVIAGSSSNLLATSMSAENPGWTEKQADMAYDEKAYIELFDSKYVGTDAYSNAIWHIFDNSVACTGACQWILNNATTAVNNDGVNGYLTYRQYTTIYTGPYTNVVNPVGNYQPQEFDQASKVPDGGMTLMLLGGALVGLGTLRRKFRV
jgi:hypothetical protein